MDVSKIQPAFVNGKNSTIVPNKESSFLATYLPHQTWSLPDTLIYYFVKNPATPKVYQKLIQSCKHFFIKNPILVISCLFSKVATADTFVLKNKKVINIYKLFSNIWVTEKLTISSKKIISSVVTKIYQCNIKELSLFHVNIYFNDFAFLASKCAKYLYLYNVTVMNEMDSAVPFEQIVGILQNVRAFQFCFGNITANIFTPNTIHNLLKTSRFTSLKKFEITNIPGSFDINNFYEYIKKNITIKIYLAFVNPLSEEYKIRLQEIVNEIIASKDRSYKLPYIYFPHMQNFDTIRELYYYGLP